MSGLRAFMPLVAGVLLLAPMTAAQSLQQSTGTVSGRATDAAGRPITHERVELVFEGVIIDTTDTGRRGTWEFANVKPGDYLVRVRESCQLVGRRVTVAPGQRLNNVEIVMPSAGQCCCCCGAAPAVARKGSPWLLPLAVAAAGAAAATTAVLVTAS